MSSNARRRAKELAYEREYEREYEARMSAEADVERRFGQLKTALEAIGVQPWELADWIKKGCP